MAGGRFGVLGACRVCHSSVCSGVMVGGVTVCLHESVTMRAAMTLNVDLVTALSREIAGELDRRLRVVSVAAAEGGSERVELLVTIAGCHRDPCILMINVTRAEPSEFERDVREKLRAALSAHCGL
jgi:hypothetical protein